MPKHMHKVLEGFDPSFKSYERCSDLSLRSLAPQKGLSDLSDKRQHLPQYLFIDWSNCSPGEITVDYLENYVS